MQVKTIKPFLLNVWFKTKHYGLETLPIFHYMYTPQNRHLGIWLMTALKNNTIRCEKLVTTISGWKIVTRLFFKGKQVSMNARTLHQHTKLWPSCLTVFAWGRACDFFQPKTFVESLLYLIVLFWKVITNQSNLQVVLLKMHKFA